MIHESLSRDRRGRGAVSANEYVEPSIPRFGYRCLTFVSAGPIRKKVMKTKKKAKRRSLRALVLTAVLTALALALFAGAAPAAPPWSDTDEVYWAGYSTAGLQVTSAKVATVAGGYEDGTFKPGAAVTRGQLAKMAIDGLGLSTSTPLIPTFRDVLVTHTYFPWVEGGLDAGIMGGFDDGTFRPDTPVSRQQANSILGRFLSQEELKLTGHIHGELDLYGSLNSWFAAEGATVLAAFADGSSLTAMHEPTTAYLAYQDVVQGSARLGGLYLDPDSSLTRAQAVVMILRVGSTTFSTTGLHLHVTGITNPIVAGTASDVTVTVVDEDDTVVVGYTGTIHFTSTDSAAVLPASYTFTALDAGSHAFAGGVTLKTAGLRTVIATGTGMGTIAGWQTVTVAPAVLDHFAFGTIASPKVAGTPFSVTIAAKDFYGNTVNAFADFARLSATTSVIVPSRTSAFVAGMWTGNVTISTAGTQAITATGSAKTGTSTTFVVTAGPVSATGSTVTASPASVVADGIATSTITVTLKDQNGNPVAGKTVTLAKTSGPGTPTISAASGPSDFEGVATFTVRSIAAGVDVFTATDTTDADLVLAQTATVAFTSAQTYTVTYHGNGSTGGSVPVDSAVYLDGATVTTASNPGSLAKAGHSFAGWNTKADGTGTPRAAGSTFAMGTADVSLYAVWTIASYTITFDKNDGAATGTTADQVIAYGSSANLRTNGFTKSGWSFAGWATSAGGAVAYGDGASYTMGPADVTLFAKWSAIPVPVVSVESPTENTTPTWSWTLAGNAQWYRYHLDVPGWTWTTNPVSINPKYTPDTPLALGNHTLSVQQSVDGTVWSESGAATVAIILNPAAPSVSFVSTDYTDVTPEWIWDGPAEVTSFRYRMVTCVFSSSTWSKPTSLPAWVEVDSTVKTFTAPEVPLTAFYGDPAGQVVVLEVQQKIGGYWSETEESVVYVLQKNIGDGSVILYATSVIYYQNSSGTVQLFDLMASAGAKYFFSITNASLLGTVWGTWLYTNDSAVARAAIHAGKISSGGTGIVKVKYAYGATSYTASTANGVVTYSWGSWPGSYIFLD
jgi:uncharacterized repeat protein (TIGR02543 family)